MSLTPSHWSKDQFLISTSQELLQTEVISKAFAVEYTYWTNPMPDDRLRKMLSNSLCFGVYILPAVASCRETADVLHPTQIGLSRVVTDESTFAYLTDVFVVPEYRGRGLGRWMMECINETLDAWPDLRRAMLFTSGEPAKAFYAQTMGMKVFETGINGLVVMERRGLGSVYNNDV